MEFKIEKILRKTFRIDGPRSQVVYELYTATGKEDFPWGFIGGGFDSEDDARSFAKEYASTYKEIEFKV